MEIERFVRITLTEEVANAIIAEIGTLEDKFDKCGRHKGVYYMPNLSEKYKD
jgi:hypothetical protein